MEETIDKNASLRRKVLLIIMDGFGMSSNKANNGIALADTSNLDKFFDRYPYTSLSASGLAVGLPQGQMGNSEVGHLIMGCGMVIHQDLVQIDASIEDGSFFKNPVLCSNIDAVAGAGGRLHLIGLVSDGGVHSHIRHLSALIKLCSQRGVVPVLHMITDGRDTAPRAALNYTAQVVQELSQAGGCVASVMGRYYAMDRDHRWDRTHEAWKAIVYGLGRPAEDVETAIKEAYENDERDEFIVPTIMQDAVPLQKNDAVLFFNFRKDRPRQIVAALNQKNFADFDRGDFLPINVTCMTRYNPSWDLPYAFEQEHPEITLAQIISDKGLLQFHCAETEKEPHVSYFFNGGRGEVFPGEERVFVPSPKVSTYDEMPEMCAAQVGDAVIGALQSEKFAFLVVNFANGDMVGHTAIPSAILKAIATVDLQVGRLVDTALQFGYSCVVTADHGNCEEMIDPESGESQTHHTLNPVPCIIIDNEKWDLDQGAGLSAVAPTILQLMGLPIPESMHGKSILNYKKEEG